VPRNLTWRAIRSRSGLEANVQQHEAIRSAIESGDPLAARAAMRDHIRKSGELIAEWFDNQRLESKESDVGPSPVGSEPSTV
jgi:DNA-binding GntR family transcriptional regulator